MTTAIPCAIFTINDNIIKLSFWHFRLNEHGSIQIIYNGEHLINNDGLIGGNQDIINDFCDYVEQNLNTVGFLNENGEEFCEKLAVMVVKGDLHLSINDVLQVSDEFYERSITLVIVSSETPPFEIWDLYRTSARNTGGEYMLLTDAPRILSHVISSVLSEEDTFRQAFLHMAEENARAIPDVDGRLEEEYETVNNIADGDFDFNHGLSY
ncbi:unnamed protein product [Rotaria sp. Silwood2]|nr:unnamed protein product [Rotaria sp. Silwood2]